MTAVAEPTADEWGWTGLPEPARTPPQDIVAEQCVLGAMMLSADAAAQAAETVQAADFYLATNRTIFEAIVGMIGRNEPVDMVTVAAKLADDGALVRVGGAPYLHTCQSAIPTAANLSHYAALVARRAKRRRLIEAGVRITQLGYSQGGLDEDELVDLAQQAVYELTDRSRVEDWTLLADAFQPTLDEIEAIGKAGGALRGIPTGFTDLDRLLNGLLPGQLAVVAGRPGSGKSTMAAGDIVRSTAIRHGMASALFSMEMPKVEIVMRLLSAEARVPLHVLRSGNLSDDDWTKLARRMGEIAEAPLFIDDTPNMTLMQIRAKARRLKQQHDLKLIVVDYLGLITSTKKTTSREQEVADISRGLKLLAMEVGVPVVAVHQLNRGPEQRQDKRPQLSDLRDSGSVEQDADIVIFVHRDDYYDKESARAGEADFILAKHRNGPTDTVTVAAQLHLSRFVDMAIV